jgi:microsomal dipeptidase-like Zn-dependent dipeptidase
MPEIERKKEAYMQIFWDNVFRGIQAVNQKSAWDIFCIGSDFDGGIEHMEPYDGEDKMQNLWMDLYSFLERNQYQKQLWFGYKPEELVNKIMFQNLINFSERHFV